MTREEFMSIQTVTYGPGRFSTSTVSEEPIEVTPVTKKPVEDKPATKKPKQPKKVRFDLPTDPPALKKQLSADAPVFVPKTSQLSANAQPFVPKGKESLLGECPTLTVF
jgi:hypothetical protein